jgi:hypothetical protein
MPTPTSATAPDHGALLRPLLPTHSGRPYADVLADLSRRVAIRNYLEIGVSTGSLLSRITCAHAIGVDPAFDLRANVTMNKSHVSLYQMKSDDFFKTFDRTALRPGHVDMAMIDGLHLAEFALKDFYNTERLCAPGSTIVIHDCLPLNPLMAMRETTLIPELSARTPFANWWTGDVWKLIPILKHYRPDLDVVLADAAPTGLVFVRKLDPASTVLEKNYGRIIDEHIAIPNEIEQLQRLCADLKILPVEQVVDDLAVSFRPQGETPSFWRRWRR